MRRAPAAASAAIDRSAAVDKDTTSFAWDSKLGTGFTTLTDLHDKVPCGTTGLHDCDITLVKVTGEGTLVVTNDPLAVDTDLYIYESDADGNNNGQLGYSAQSSPTPNEVVSADTGAGVSWFLVEIDYTDNIGGKVHGVATFTPLPPEDGGEG